MEKPKTHHINCVERKMSGDSYSDNTLLVEGYHIRFGVGEVGPGDAGRKVFGGELVPGPWAYVWGHSTVIDNFGGTGREMEEQRKRGCVVDARVGDFLEINGRKYRIVKTSNRDYVDLELVTRKTNTRKAV